MQKVQSIVIIFSNSTSGFKDIQMAKFFILTNHEIFFLKKEELYINILSLEVYT